jgi:hypothetical protein
VSFYSVRADTSFDVSIAQQVNDILRNKLYSVSEQLANAEVRVRELEDGERTRLLGLLEEIRGAESRNDFRQCSHVPWP